MPLTTEVPSPAALEPPLHAPSPSRRSEAQVRARRRRQRGFLIAAIVLVAAGFLFSNRGILAAPFGSSFDGVNGGRFALQIRSIEHNGFVDSRVGGRYAASGHGAPDVTYADHPPLVYVEGYVSRLIGGTGQAATRAPAWIGSLAAIVLLAWLLIDAGLSPIAAAAGVAIGLGSSMFFVYGTMLDTFITSLPFGLAALLAAQRTVRRRPFPWAVTAALGAMAALAGWQALLVTACGVLWIAVSSRHDKAWWRRAAPLAGGLAAGTVSVAVWIWWVDGSFAALLDQGSYRAGSIDLRTWFDYQIGALRSLFNPVVVIVSPLLVAAACMTRRTRGPMICLLVTVGLYCVAFRQGAANHVYWNYWLVLALAVGGAATWDLVASRWRDARRTGALVALGLLAVSCLVIPTFFDRSASRRVLTDGTSAPYLLDRAEKVRNGPITVAVNAVPEDPEAWIPYRIGVPIVTFQDQASLRAQTERHPGLLVFTKLPDAGPRRVEILDRAVVADRHFALVPATSMP